MPQAAVLSPPEESWSCLQRGRAHIREAGLHCTAGVNQPLSELCKALTPSYLPVQPQYDILCHWWLGMSGMQLKHPGRLPGSTPVGSKDKAGTTEAARPAMDCTVEN